MKTGGYDVLVEIDKRLVNHALAAAYFSTFYRTFEGSAVIKTGGVLGDLARVDYRLELNEPPFIDFLSRDRFMARLTFKAIMVVIGRNVRMDVSVDLLGRMGLDPLTKEISIEILGIKLGKLRLLDRFELPNIARMLVNEALAMAINSSFVRGMKREGGLIPVTATLTSAPKYIHLEEGIKISLLPGFLGMIIKVPTIELEVSSLIPANRLNLDVSEVDMAVFPGFFGVTGDKIIVLAISVGENVFGDPTGIKDFTEGNDIAIGLSEASLNRILDEVWPHVPKDVMVSGNIPVDNISKLMESLQEIKDMPQRFDALGLTQKNTEVKKALIDFSATINLQKPKVGMGEGSTFEAYETRAKAKVQATVKATELTTIRKGRNAFISPWTTQKEQKPPETKQEEVTLYSFDTDIDVLLKRAVIGLQVDTEGRLTLEVPDVDFSFDIPGHIPKFVFEMISNKIEERIKENFPAIDLTEMIQQKIEPIFPFKPQLRIVKVSTEGSEAVIIGNLDFGGVSKHIVPEPSYLTDSRTISREVHRPICPPVGRIPERVQDGYTSLNVPSAKGMKRADDRLPEFRQGVMENERTLTFLEIEIPLVATIEKSKVTGDEALKSIPIVEMSISVDRKIPMIGSGSEAADGDDHEVQGEEQCERSDKSAIR